MKHKKSAERYRKGEISVEKAAKEAETDLWSMINHLNKENITSPPETEEELEKEYQETVS